MFQFALVACKEFYKLIKKVYSDTVPIPFVSKIDNCIILLLYRDFNVVFFSVSFTFKDDLFCLVPVTTLHGAFQLPVISAVEVSKDAILVLEAAESGSGLFGRDAWCWCS